ncbi:MAG: hypothetical protein ACHQM4_07835 [Thermoanaerobaculia bacterium]
MTLVWDRLSVPFLDTRLHYFWDSAFTTFNARSGNRVGGLRCQFGTTLAEFVRWGEPVGRPRHYTDHPFLIQATFQQAARLIGTSEMASRSFSLLVSFGIAAGLFILVIQTTSSVFAAVAGGLVLVSLPVFSTFQVSAKYELNGMLLGVWQFVALVAFLRSGTARARKAHVILTALTFLAHWTAALSAGLTGAFLAARFWRHREGLSRRALLSTFVGGTAGLALLASLMAFVQGGFREAWAPLAESFSRRSQGVPLPEWAARQRLYLGVNFGWTLLAALLGMLILLAGRRISRREDPESLLSLFIAVSALTGCAWLLLFRQGSFIHVYWQLWLALPCGALAAAFVASLHGRRRMQVLAGIFGLLLCLHLRRRSVESYEDILRVQLGKAEDIEFLKSLRRDRFRRMVFVPLTEDPLNEWFQGPLFEYYTDRPVAVLNPDETPPKSGEKLLVLRCEERLVALPELESRFGLRLTNETCGPRFCAYDVGER